MDEQSIFLQALEQPAGEPRAKWLNQACGVDSPLRQRMEALLKRHEEARSFLEQPAAEQQAPMVAEAVGKNLAESLQAGLTAAFTQEQAVVLGDGNHSVLRMLAQRLDAVPRVALREAGNQGVDPIVRPKSSEMPLRDSDSRYRLDGEIARGGMGAIIKGRDTDLGRDLAIKVLLEAHKDKPEVIQRFIEEAQIGGQLQHPGIAPVYELGQFADRRPFFSMKLVKGETLSKLLEERKGPAEDRGRFLGVFEQVCQTMAYAHSRGVIHRDLKPANIMVGAFGEVQVMDWGLAKVLPAGGVADEKKARNKQQGQSVIQTLRSGVGSDVSGVVGSIGSHTQMGSVMGTPAYMPPEQALGEIDNLDERADVFGLGAILCEILTGKPPYVADDGTRVFRMASRGKLDECFARLHACGADAELIALTKHCLEVEPADRPRDAGILAERVTGYLESVESKLRQAEVDRAAEAARVIELRRRRKLLYALAGMLLIGLITAGFAANHFRNLEATQRELADKNQQLAVEREKERNAAVAAREAETRQRELAETAKAQAVKERERAEDRERTTQQTLYVAEMNLAAQAAEVTSGIRRVGQITRSWDPKQASRDLRGWEWFYLESLQHAYRMRLEHTGAFCVAYSPDGTRLASGGRDGVMRLCNVASGKLISELRGHTACIHEIAWSPDGSRIATAGRDMTVRIWNATTGVSGPPLSHSNVVISVCWSPDGSKLAARPSDEVVIWNAETAQPVTRWREPEYEATICWHPKSNLLSSSGGVYDADTGKSLWKHDGGSSQWSPDGKRLATCARGASKINLWSAEDGSPSGEFSAEAASFLTLSWSPSGRELAAAGRDAAVRIWDTQTRAELAVLRGHTGWINVNGVGWRPDGKQLASASDDQTVIIWDWPATPNPLVIPSGQAVHPGTINWDAGGTSLIVGTEKAAIWDVDTRRSKITIDAGRGGINYEASPATSWNSTAHLFAARRNGAIILFDDRTGEVRHELPRIDGDPRSLALSPDGSKLAVPAYHRDPGNVEVGKVHLFDTTTGRKLWVATVPVFCAGSVAWSHDGTKLASASWLDAVVLNAADGAILKKINGQSGAGWIQAITWSPADDRIALACMNHQVRIYDAVDGRELKTLVGHTAAVRGVSWSGDGRRIATCGNDKTVRIWDPDLGMQTMIFPNLKHDVMTVAWSPDGMRLAAACYNSEVHVWDASIGLARSESPQLLAKLDQQLQADPNDVAKRRLRMRINERLRDQAAVERDRSFLLESLLRKWESNPTSDDAATELAQTMVSSQPSLHWTPLQPVELKSESGCSLTQETDGSILAGPANTPQGDTYTVRARSPLRKVSRLQLETLPHPSLPQQGQGWVGGNFCLTELRVEVQRSDGTRIPLAIKAIASDYARMVDPDTSIVDGPWSVVDGDQATRWDIHPQLKTPHWLALEVIEPIDLAEKDELLVHLDFHDPRFPQFRLGRFRLSVGEDAGDLTREQLLAAVRANQFDGLVLLAAAFIASGDLQRAAKLLETATAENDSVTRLMLRTLVQQRLGNSESARATAKQLVEALKTETPARLLQDQCANLVVQTGVLTRPQFFNRLQKDALDVELARLTKQIEAAPKEISAHRNRGLLHARLGRWRECAADYLQMVRLKPQDRLLWGPASSALALTGDKEEYRQFCQELVEQFRGTDQADIADTVCKSSLMLPGMVTLSDLPIQVVRDGVTDPKWSSYFHPWFYACSALISYREDKPAEAIAWTKKIDSLKTQPGALALVVRAMAEEKQGQHEQAVKTLAEVEAIIPIELRTLGNDDFAGVLPVSQTIVGHDWLVPEILRREADAFINGKP